MAILIDKNTRVLVQGITGRDGSFHTLKMLEYGTKVVGGVTPSKGGQEVHGVPVFNSVDEAVKETNPNATIIFVPAKFAYDAIMEAIENKIKLIVVVTEGIPAHQMMKVLRKLKESGDTILIGPNCPGVISPGKSKVGIMPGHIFMEGNVGIVSRSGTLTYEIVSHLTQKGIGQSTVVGIGGDPLIGTRFKEVLEMFEKDEETKAIVLIGEIGGTDEEEASEFIKKHITKPVVAFVAGQTAPPEKRMGHAGAIISGGTGTAQEKIRIFKENGIPVANTPKEVSEILSKIL